MHIATHWFLRGAAILGLGLGGLAVGGELHDGFSILVLIGTLLIPPWCFAMGLHHGLKDKNAKTTRAKWLNSIGLLLYGLWISGGLGLIWEMFSN